MTTNLDDASANNLPLPKDADEYFNVWHESKLLFSISLPSVAVQLSLLLVFPQTASIVGRTLGTEALAGFSLGSLVGNLTCLSVMVGALTAADTLMPRAYGSGNHSEIGRLAIRGFVLCSFLLVIPIIPLCTAMEWAFDKLGQDEHASHLASEWIRVYLIGVPAMLLFRVVQSFLNAQHKVWPLVVSSVVSCFVVHPIFLRLFLRFGFIGSSLAIVMTQYVNVILLFIHMQFLPVHEASTWSGINKEIMQQSLATKPMLEFLSLSLGGVLSLSEWWFWETVCFIVGSFGVVPLCVHTIAYNLVPLLFMIPLGIMIGLTVRMGNLLSEGYVHKAKLLAAWCMAFTAVIGLLVALLLYQYRVRIAMLFTTDEEIIDGCKQIWPMLCIHVFILHILGINSAILRSLGMQWRMAAIMFVCLWLITLPIMVVQAMQNEGGINSVWHILPICYAFMQLLLIASYVGADWNEISREIRAATPPKNNEIINESTRLI